jgi:hypothetical protein
MAARLAVTVLVLLLFVSQVQGTVYRVPSEYPTIRDALQAINQEGDTVLVAPGTYTGWGNKDLLLAFEVMVMSEQGPDMTVIDCEDESRAFRIIQGNPPTIEGFTITNGRDSQGGAIHCEQSSPEIVNCRIMSSRASNPSGAGHGGGVYCYGGAPRLVECVIQGNEATEGGGIYCLESELRIDNCLITGNEGFFGGGLFQRSGFVEIRSATFSGNLGAGGGIHARDAASAHADRSILWGNCLIVDGISSQVYLSDAQSTLSMSCCAVDSIGLTGQGLFAFLDESVFTDPRFCEPLDCQAAPSVGGDYTLFSNSPCLPENSPCGLLIGALGEGCDGPTATKPTTWGRIKSLFRQQGR